MTARSLIASGAIALSIAGIGYAAHPGTATKERPPRCTPTHIMPHEWRCTFPTHSHLRATVYVKTWEDGSARAVAIDPDRRNAR